MQEQTAMWHHTNIDPTLLHYKVLWPYN